MRLSNRAHVTEHFRKRDGTRGRDEPMHPGSPRSASICGLYHGNWGLRGGATPIPVT
jgi:hypothetical protein